MRTKAMEWFDILLLINGKVSQSIYVQIKIISLLLRFLSLPNYHVYAIRHGSGNEIDGKSVGEESLFLNLIYVFYNCSY